MTSSTLIRVLVVDDHPIVRCGLTSLLAATPDLRVTGTAGDYASALEAVEQSAPDVLVVDLSLSEGGDGLMLIEALRRRDIRTPALVYSMHDEVIYAERVLQAGAAGFLMKSEAPSQLIEALRLVAAGGIWISPAMSARFVGSAARRREGGERHPLERLSNRELAVYRALGQGLAVSDIAAQLHISPKTVETHQRRMREKLHLNSARELLRYALRWSDAASEGPRAPRSE